MKKFLLTILFLLLASPVSAAYYVNDPTDCLKNDPTNYPGQDCTPNYICGVTSGIVQCYNNATLNPPTASTTSNTLYSGSFGGGFLMDCYRATSCNAGYCNRSATCYTTKQRDTVCTKDAWETATCGDCRSGYLDCTSDDACEIQIGVSAWTQPNSTYLTCSTAQCSTGFQACEGETATTNGCNYETGVTSCTTEGGEPGTYAAGCTCEALPQEHFITNTLAEAWGNILLWGKQLNPTGWLINVYNSVTGARFAVDQNGNASTTGSMTANTFCIGTTTPDCIAEWSSGGGNPFNQWLDTTNSPEFAGITITGESSLATTTFNGSTASLVIGEVTSPFGNFMTVTPSSPGSLAGSNLGFLFYNWGIINQVSDVQLSLFSSGEEELQIKINSSTDETFFSNASEYNFDNNVLIDGNMSSIRGLINSPTDDGTTALQVKAPEPDSGDCIDDLCIDEMSCEASPYQCLSTWNVGVCNGAYGAFCSNSTDCISAWDGNCGSTWADGACADENCTDQPSCEASPTTCGGSGWDEPYCDDGNCSDQTSCEADRQCASTWVPDQVFALKTTGDASIIGNFVVSKTSTLATTTMSYTSKIGQTNNYFEVVRDDLKGGGAVGYFPFIKFTNSSGVYPTNFGGFLGGVGIVVDDRYPTSNPTLAFMSNNIAEIGAGAVGSISYTTSTEKMSFDSNSFDFNNQMSIGSGGPNGSDMLSVHGNMNLDAGYSYKYNNVNLAYGSSTKHNWYFGEAGNLINDLSYNVGIGYGALLESYDEQGDVAIGRNALKLSNSAIGYNVAVGYSAGYDDTYGVDGTANSILDRHMTFLGTSATRDDSIPTTTALLYGTAIGSKATVYSSYQVALGGTNNSSTITFGKMGIGTSDPAAWMTVLSDDTNNLIRIGTTTAPDLFVMDKNGNITSANTFSGNVRFTGEPVFNGTVTINGALYITNTSIYSSAIRPDSDNADGRNIGAPTYYWKESYVSTTNAKVTNTGNLSITGLISMAANVIMTWVNGAGFRQTSTPSMIEFNPRGNGWRRMADTQRWESDFMSCGTTAINPPFFGVAISSGTLGTGNGTANNPGVCELSDSTTANGGYIFVTGDTSLYITGIERFSMIFKSSASTMASTTYQFGFLDNTSGTSQPTDGAYFYATASSTIYGKTAIATVASTTATGYTMSSSTFYTTSVVINSDATRADFYIYDSAGNVLWTDYLTGNIPKNSLTGAGVIVTEGKTTDSGVRMSIDYMSVEIDRTLSRFIP